MASSSRVRRVQNEVQLIRRGDAVIPVFSFQESREWGRESSSDTQDDVEYIWPIDRNLILNLGQPVGCMSKPKLCMDSQMMREASEVFEELLEPAFAMRKRQGLEDDPTPFYFTFTEDYPEAMYDMCMIIHHRVPAGVNQPGCTARLLRLAEVVKKYKCTREFKSMSWDLLKVVGLEALTSASPNFNMGLHETAAAAYLFDNKKGFFWATERLIREVAFNTQDKRVLDIVPKEVRAAIETKRMIAGSYFTQDVPPLFIKPCLLCHFDCKPYIAELARTFDMPYWSAPGLAVCDMMSKVERLVGRWKIGCQCVRPANLGRITLEEVRAVQDKIVGVCAGLCLECIREKKDTVQQCPFEEEHWTEKQSGEESSDEESSDEDLLDEDMEDEDIEDEDIGDEDMEDVAIKEEELSD